MAALYLSVVYGLCTRQLFILAMFMDFRYQELFILITDFTQTGMWRIGRAPDCHGRHGRHAGISGRTLLIQCGSLREISL